MNEAGFSTKKATKGKAEKQAYTPRTKGIPSSTAGAGTEG
jgi:hypothetical protein